MATPAAAKRALSEEQKQELKEAFDLFDTEKSGAHLAPSLHTAAAANAGRTALLLLPPPPQRVFLAIACRHLLLLLLLLLLLPFGCRSAGPQGRLTTTSSRLRCGRSALT